MKQTKQTVSILLTAEHRTGVSSKTGKTYDFWSFYYPHPAGVNLRFEMPFADTTGNQLMKKHLEDLVNGNVSEDDD